MFDNWRTTLGTIMTAIGLVPQAIQSLGIETIPNWLRITGIVCSFIFFIWTGINTKDAKIDNDLQ